MPLATLLARWQSDPELKTNFTAWKTLPAHPASRLPFPGDLPRALRSTLTQRGIDQLYSHQLAAWTHARRRENIVLATGTASGKTLAYNLPILAGMLQDPEARALYLFPTKALSQDQLSQLSALVPKEANSPAAIYDGDTPARDRPAIRKNARLVLSNPDMLHTGILPHHANWSHFLAHLRFVVLDEMHTYRGVFGSHVANVVRRLKRLAAHYGAAPQFLLASATIGNPQELAENLIEARAVLIHEDGSSRGERHFLVYNPPVVDPALGLRKSSLLESVRLAQDLLAQDLQTVVFARTRRSVEILLTYLQGERPAAPGRAPHANLKARIRGYRSGYLPSQRREIESGLRDGSVRTVVATNALELGIDIGGLEAAILVGYAGTIASTRQQAGRAGRGDDPAVAVLVASPNPLDQFLAQHPEYFFGRSPEQALVNPNHLLILLAHLRCALFELPFRSGEGFGNLTALEVTEFLEVLLANHEAHFSNETYFWMADQYPAANISLRAASPQGIVLQSTSAEGLPVTVGTVDAGSAPWMVHPGAVYMHEAQQYYVQELNLEQQRAELVPVGLDYYTEAQRRSEIHVISTTCEADMRGGKKSFGEIQVTSQVVGFKKLRWFTHENLGEEPLDMPPSELQTTGYVLSLSDELVARLREAGAWTNDANEYGPDWPKVRERVRQRDGYRCQVCGTPETRRPHDVHHKTPFRAFASAAEANRLENLTTLCHTDHQKVEQNVRMRSGLGGLGFVLGNLAPLFLMSDARDLGVHTDAAGVINGLPAVVLYDEIPAGIGFSQKLFEIHDELMRRALELVEQCECSDGCPSCVGPGGENGLGGKNETLAILRELTTAA
jgi:DEAD/DEAH box helicase domain-containing protein